MAVEFGEEVAPQDNRDSVRPEKKAAAHATQQEDNHRKAERVDRAPKRTNVASRGAANLQCSHAPLSLTNR